MNSKFLSNLSQFVSQHAKNGWEDLFFIPIFAMLTSGFESEYAQRYGYLFSPYGSESHVIHRNDLTQWYHGSLQFAEKKGHARMGILSTSLEKLHRYGLMILNVELHPKASKKPWFFRPDGSLSFRIRLNPRGGLGKGAFNHALYASKVDTVCGRHLHALHAEVAQLVKAAHAAGVSTQELIEALPWSKPIGPKLTEYTAEDVQRHNALRAEQDAQEAQEALEDDGQEVLNVLPEADPFAEMDFDLMAQGSIAPQKVPFPPAECHPVHAPASMASTVKVPSRGHRALHVSPVSTTSVKLATSSRKAASSFKPAGRVNTHFTLRQEAPNPLRDLARQHGVGHLERRESTRWLTWLTQASVSEGELHEALTRLRFSSPKAPLIGHAVPFLPKERQAQITALMWKEDPLVQSHADLLLEHGFLLAVTKTNASCLKTLAFCEDFVGLVNAYVIHHAKRSLAALCDFYREQLPRSPQPEMGMTTPQPLPMDPVAWEWITQSSAPLPSEVLESFTLFMQQIERDGYGDVTLRKHALGSNLVATHACGWFWEAELDDDGVIYGLYKSPGDCLRHFKCKSGDPFEIKERRSAVVL